MTSASKSSHLRLLIVSPAQSLSNDPVLISPFPSLLEALTRSKPVEQDASFAGYIVQEPIRLRTKYYNADVNIWCDELPPPLATSTNVSTNDEANADLHPDPVQIKDTPTESTATLKDWQTQMLSGEASEVRAVIGGIILILPYTASSSTFKLVDPYHPYIEAVQTVVEAIKDEFYRNVASIALIQSTGSQTVIQSDLDKVREDLENYYLEKDGILEWDFITWDMKARSQEHDKSHDKAGIEQVLETLELTDWSAPNDSEDELDDLDDIDIGQHLRPGAVLNHKNKEEPLDEASQSLDAELQKEMMELKLSMQDNDSKAGPNAGEIGQSNKDLEGEDISIEQMQGLIEQVKVIREAGAEMSQSDREKFAKREIAKIMKAL